MRISDWSSDVCSSDLLEEELDDVSGGRAQWQAVLDRFWRDFKPRTGEVMEQKPSEITAALDEFLGAYLFPDKGGGRSEERSVGKECVRTGRSRWGPERLKKNKQRSKNTT